MSLAILGMGTALPTTVLDQEDALALARSLCQTREQETWLPTMYHGTGIEKRHSVLPRALVDDVVARTGWNESPFFPSGDPDDLGPTTAQRMEVYQQEAPRLAIQAATAALYESRLRPSELTHLVTVSCTGFCAPGVDHMLIQELELSPTIQRTHVGFMGCHGALNGLRVARAFADSDPKARVLLVAVELCSLHYHYNWNPGRMVANAIFADGAAALVGAPARTPLDRWQARASGSCVFPNSADAMTWFIGDHGFVMSLSKQVPGLIARNLRPWLEKWLEEHGLEIEDIASWAIHPGGPRILNAAREAIGLDREQTSIAERTFAEHGNMSSPTVMFIVERMRREKAPLPCIALGFGPGLSAEATLFV